MLEIDVLSTKNLWNVRKIFEKKFFVDDLVQERCGVLVRV
jgi:hypothetical protein